MPTFESLLAPVARRRLFGTVRFGLLSTFAPTTCAIATFSAALSEALRDKGSEVVHVRVSDGLESSDPREVAELIGGSAHSVIASAEALNNCDVAVIQHDYGIYGGAHGDEVLSLVDALQVPSVAIIHTVLKEPAPHQRWVLERLMANADRIVVMSEIARQRLCHDYAVDRHRIVVIPHGARLPTAPRVKRAARPLILTSGLVGPGMGIERVIDAMPSLQSAPGKPRYLIAGPTHPKVLASDGDAYRDACIERARHNGVADSVSFDDRFYSRASLITLMQSAAVIALPYDSEDQVTSGVLVDAVAAGRPVVATAFPHAVELLRNGAGITVAHDDSGALAAALRRVVTQPRLAGSMAAEARQLAPAMAWPVVADAYEQLALRVLADLRARS